MATHSLDLDFRKPQKEFSGPSIAQIYIKASSANEKGTRFITPQCVTFQEFDCEIKRLEKELQTIR